jgi:hypothetical protein
MCKLRIVESTPASAAVVLIPQELPGCRLGKTDRENRDAPPARAFAFEAGSFRDDVASLAINERCFHHDGRPLPFNDRSLPSDTLSFPVDVLSLPSNALSLPVGALSLPVDEWTFGVKEWDFELDARSLRPHELPFRGARPTFGCTEGALQLDQGPFGGASMRWHSSPPASRINEGLPR